LLDPAHEDYDAYVPQQPIEMRKASGPDGARPGGKLLEALLTANKKQLSQLLDFAIDRALRCPPARGLLVRLPAIQHYRRLYRRLFAQEMADWPPAIREELIERHVSAEWLWAGVREARNVEQLYDEVRRGGPLPDVPLVVLCSTQSDDFRRAVAPGESDALLREEIEGKRRLYTALAASVRRGEVRTVDAGHFTMHFRHPDAVVRAIRDVANFAG